MYLVLEINNLGILKKKFYNKNEMENIKFVKQHKLDKYLDKKGIIYI